MGVNNLFTDDLTNVPPPDLEQAIVKLAASGVEEKFRLDFKEKWDAEKQIPDVAALANSYGGLLVVGVSDDRQRFPGTPQPKNSDLKTQISSQIATRVSPVPIFEVHTSAAPDDRNNLLVVIRVSPQARVHMCLKGDKPVYIRNEDGTIPARAPQLQALLDRVRMAETGGEPSFDPLTPVARDFFITKANSLADRHPVRQQPNNRSRSDTNLLVGLAPERAIARDLDVTLEQKFKDTIYQVFPSIEARRAVDLGTSIIDREDRGRSWFRYHHVDLDRDHELICALDSRGIIQCLFEVADRLGSGDANLWSIPDVFISLNGAIRLAHDLWTAMGFFGSAQVAVKLQVSKLVPFSNNGNYPALFYESAIAIPETAVRKTLGNYEVAIAGASTVLTYDGRTSQRKDSVVSLGNQLLRDLRFAVDLKAVYAALVEV